MKYYIILLLITLNIGLSGQIDTVNTTFQGSLLFPTFPVKSSFTNVMDRNGMPIVYSANMESGLGIYEISDPTDIKLISDLGIGIFNGLDVSTVRQYGNLLFLGIGDFQVDDNEKSGLAIVDVTGPYFPVLRDVWDSTAFTHGISHLLVEGDYAYLSTMTDGIIILNISDVDNIKFQSSLELDLNFPSSSPNAHNARGLKLRNDSLFVCMDRGGLRVVDVADKTAPAEIYKYINTDLNEVAAAAYNDVVIKDNYAFMSVDYCGLEIVDISSTPFSVIQWFNPQNCSGTNWSGSPMHLNEIKLTNNDSLLIVSAGQSEFFIFDITNPLDTKKKGEFAMVNDTLACHGIDVYNGQIAASIIHTPIHVPPFTPFFSKTGGIQLYDYEIINDPSNIQIPEETLSISIFPNPARDLIYINAASRFKSLIIYDHLGKLVKHYYWKGGVHKMQIDLSNFSNGLYLLSFSDDENIQTERLVINRN